MKNKNLKIYLIFMFWCLPLLISLNMMSNMSKKTTEYNKKTLLSSIPINCKLNTEEMECDDKKFSIEALSFIQDVKKQAFDQIENTSCRLFVISDNYMKSLLPVKYFTPQNDYKILIGCLGEEAMYKNLWDYAATQINSSYSEKQSCKKELFESSTVLNINGKFLLSNEGVYYLCDDLDKKNLTEKEMFKHFFIQECSLRLIQEKNNPFTTCEQLYDMFSTSSFKQSNVLKDSKIEFKGMDFLNEIKNK